MSIEKTLAERGARYGEFRDLSKISQEFKEVLNKHSKNLGPLHKEALEMIIHKISRILNGDPNYDDNWRDISGFATLVLNEVNKIPKTQ